VTFPSWTRGRPLSYPPDLWPRIKGGVAKSLGCAPPAGRSDTRCVGRPRAEDANAMHCLLCHEKIPRMRRLKKWDFCCDEHMEQYKQETLKRLLEYGAPQRFPAADDPIHHLEVLTNEPDETTTPPQRPVSAWQLQPFTDIDLQRYAPVWAPASALLATRLLSPRHSFSFSAASLAGDSKLVRRPRVGRAAILPGPSLIARGPQFASPFRPRPRPVCPGLVVSSGAASLAAAPTAGLRTVTAASGWAPVGIPLAVASIDMEAADPDVRSAPPLLASNVPDGFESVQFATPRKNALTFRRLVSPLRDHRVERWQPAQAALWPNPAGARVHFPASCSARNLEDSPPPRQSREILQPFAGFRVVELAPALPAMQCFAGARPLLPAGQVAASNWVTLDLQGCEPLGLQRIAEPSGAPDLSLHRRPVAPDAGVRLAPLNSAIR